MASFIFTHFILFSIFELVVIQRLELCVHARTLHVWSTWSTWVAFEWLDGRFNLDVKLKPAVKAFLKLSINLYRTKYFPEQAFELLAKLQFHIGNTSFF